MSRGGRRQGAGRKSLWNHTETVPLRVPKIFSEELTELARKLDAGADFDFEQNQIFSVEQQEKLLEILSKWTERRKFISRNTGKWSTAHRILDEVEPIIESVENNKSLEQMSFLEPK